VGRGLGDQNSAVSAGAGDNPYRAAIEELPALLDLFVGAKHQHLGGGSRVGDHNRLPSMSSRGPTRPVVRRDAHPFENPWSQGSVLMYIDGGDRQKVHCGS